MQLKTILNRVHKFKSFVCGQVRWEQIEGKPALLVEVFPRSNGRAVCSGCTQPRAGYDTLEPRTFEFVPLWGIAVFFI